MPTKTDRILSYLPQTFRALPRPNALYSVVDAFGKELLLAENSLAALMQAHWVDHADRGAEVIEDLARIGALYGLAPRPDESVEDFREHLKRYIRTFLEGTVTVQGILRVTAETLGLKIADTYEELDSWWTRIEDSLTSFEPSGEDAAELLFGIKSALVSGASDQAARVIGRVDLSPGIDLGREKTLRLKLDADGPIEIDLSEGASDSASVTLDEMAEAINAALGGLVARQKGSSLTLSTPTVGEASRIEILEVPGDAAERVLGLPPRTYQGSESLAAQVTGIVDLSGGIDLSQEHYLRLMIDGIHLAEIDVAGSVPAETSLDQVRSAINSALGIEVAKHDGHFLSLCSPTKGFSSQIVFKKTAAQDATSRLFGVVDAFHLGQDAQVARARGRRNLSEGIDLSEDFNIQLQVDNLPSVLINCAGLEPKKTQAFEISTAINTAMGFFAARQDGQFMTIISGLKGLDGKVVFERPEVGDATEAIFGIKSRIFEGAMATAARIPGRPELLDGVDLRARHFLKVAVDGSAPLEIDLRSAAVEPCAEKVSLDDAVKAINDAFFADIASHDGQGLALLSPTTGSASHLAILPLETRRSRRFVTRAMITDEAAQPLFGFISREAEGAPASSARIVGNRDLSRGSDLREARYLRLAIDDQVAVDIDCAGRRARATLITEIVDQINKTVEGLARHDGKHLVLTSPSSGTKSRIVMEAPRATDALDRLLGLEPGLFRGINASRVAFVGTVDLGAGIDLEAHTAIKLGLDGADPIEISLSDTEGSHKSLNQIVATINVALEGPIASHNGAHLLLTSRKIGMESQIVFSSPAGTDVTPLLFGITAPRSYQGNDPLPARVLGSKNLSAGIDLRTARFLRLSIDGRPEKDVDCASEAANPEAVRLDEIVTAINTAFEVQEGDEADWIASHDGSHLILKSLKTGLSGRITLAHHRSGDARQALFGAIDDVVTGRDPLPATITGEVDLLRPADLSKRHQLRLSVDGSRPFEIDVAGAAPATTFLDEIVEAINRLHPGLAKATENDRLRLTSPSTGKKSQLSLLPLRYLELIEYPPEAAAISPLPVRHGDTWSIINDGAASQFAEIEITTTQGIFGASLLNTILGWRVRLLSTLNPGETVRLRSGEKRGLQASITSVDGSVRALPESEILVGPLGVQARVPFEGTCHLGRDGDNQETLQLNNPLADGIVTLRTRSATLRKEIGVRVVESQLGSLALSPTGEGMSVRMEGRIRQEGSAYRLFDREETLMARLRAGPDIDLSMYRDRIVSVLGLLHKGFPPMVMLREIAQLFDVDLIVKEGEGPSLREHYKRVTIGLGAGRADSLVRQINFGAHFSASSKIAKAEECPKKTVLSLGRGKSNWRYLDCHVDRFNQSHFDSARFSGDPCSEYGVFNISRFAKLSSEPVSAVFAPSGPLSAPSSEMRFRWTKYRPGAFVVNLPADLPDKFGGRFNEARFGQEEGAPQIYEKAVTEPPDDERFLVSLMNEGEGQSALIEAVVVPRVPLGWRAFEMPFRKPQSLSLGGDDAAARLYLSEAGLEGFIELKAREKGRWGNKIAVSARASGPAMYDISTFYEGACFEKAREISLGRPLPEQIRALLEPGAIALLQTKAAGVQVEVTRDRTGTI